jgi:hypothetical protein
MAVEKPQPLTRDSFPIHEDPEEMDGQEVGGRFVDQLAAPVYQEQWNSEEDETEEEDEEEEVDETVLEDMRKLEMTFKGISERFRLINRIGEGDVLASALLSNDTNKHQEHSQPSIKPKTSSTINTATIGTKTANTTMSGTSPGNEEDFKTLMAGKDAPPTSPSKRST